MRESHVKTECHWICLLSLCLLFTNLILGCGEKVDEKASVDEKAKKEKVLAVIDQMWGGVPDDYPKDVPIITGMKGITNFRADGCYTLTGIVESSVDEAIAYYEESLAENGWSLNEEMEESGVHIKTFLKDPRGLMLCISENNRGYTTVVLVQYEDASTMGPLE